MVKSILSLYLPKVMLPIDSLPYCQKCPPSSFNFAPSPSPLPLAEKPGVIQLTK